MRDDAFKQAVANRDYSFDSATNIYCQLETHKTYDEDGELIKQSYIVTKVHDFEQLGSSKVKVVYKQKDLFENVRF